MRTANRREMGTANGHKELPISNVPELYLFLFVSIRALIRVHSRSDFGFKSGSCICCEVMTL